MVKNLTFNVSFNSFSFKWEEPTILPYSYKMDCTCLRMGCGVPYYKSSKSIAADHSEVIMLGLAPRSTCFVKFWAEYGTASIDPGISHVVNTTQRCESTARNLMNNNSMHLG